MTIYKTLKSKNPICFSTQTKISIGCFSAPMGGSDPGGGEISKSLKFAKSSYWYFSCTNASYGRKLPIWAIFHHFWAINPPFVPDISLPMGAYDISDTHGPIWIAKTKNMTDFRSFLAFFSHFWPPKNSKYQSHTTYWGCQTPIKVSQRASMMINHAFFGFFSVFWAPKKL